MILICGNGGLAAESNHFAAELTGKYYKDIYIPCISLCANEAQLTALTNDIGWIDTYAHLVRVFGKEGDTFIGLTTSFADNIIQAYNIAQNMGLKTILYTRHNLRGKNVAEKQEDCIKKLHKLAIELKEKELK